jgi:hypothetical protein
MRLGSLAIMAALALGVSLADPSAEGQSQPTTHRIAFLGGGGQAPLLRLLQALQPRGYEEGRNLVVERRLA